MHSARTPAREETGEAAVTDAELHEEIELVATLVAAAHTAGRPLTPAEIDDLLQVPRGTAP